MFTYAFIQLESIRNKVIVINRLLEQRRFTKTGTFLLYLQLYTSLHHALRIDHGPCLEHSHVTQGSSTAAVSDRPRRLQRINGLAANSFGHPRWLPLRHSLMYPTSRPKPPVLISFYFHHVNKDRPYRS